MANLSFSILYHFLGNHDRRLYVPTETALNDKNRFLFILRGGLILALAIRKTLPQFLKDELLTMVLGDNFQLEDWQLQLDMLTSIQTSKIPNYEAVISATLKKVPSTMRLPLQKVLPELIDLQRNELNFSKKISKDINNEIQEEDLEDEEDRPNLEKDAQSSQEIWIVGQYLQHYGLETLIGEMESKVADLKEQRKKFKEIEREKNQQ